MTTPPMQLTEINGVKLELFDGGNQSGEPLVYIHGGGSVEFQAVAREPSLAETYRIIYIHRRGYGKSDFPDTPISIAQYAADTRAILDFLGLEQAHFAAESSGSIILLQYMMDYPETVRSLVLMEPPLPFVVGESPMFHEMMERADSLYQAGDKAGAVDAFLTGVCSPDYRALFDANLPSGWFEQMVNDIEAITQVESQAMDNWTFSRKDAARITQPVLNLTGSETPSFLRECYETVQAWIPHAESVVLPETPHCMVETNPKGVAENLAGFFSRHPIAETDPKTVSPARQRSI